MATQVTGSGSSPRLVRCHPSPPRLVADIRLEPPAVDVQRPPRDVGDRRRREDQNQQEDAQQSEPANHSPGVSQGFQSIALVGSGPWSHSSRKTSGPRRAAETRMTTMTMVAAAVRHRAISDRAAFRMSSTEGRPTVPRGTTSRRYRHLRTFRHGAI